MMSLSTYDDKISFETYSDAKFAQLLLGRTLSTTALDAVLDVFCDPSFRISELSFRKAQDLYSHISKERRINAEERCFNVNRDILEAKSLVAKDRADDKSTEKPRVPLLVIELLVEFVNDFLKDFAPLSICAEERDGETLSFIFEDLCLLRNLALVHRTWTPIAQRVLRTRAFICGDDLLEYLLNPLCNDWVKEVQLTICDTEDRTLNFARDIGQNFRFLISRIPNLQRFHLVVGRTIPVNPHLQLITMSCLNALRSASSLKMLYLDSFVHRERDAPRLGPFIAVLPFLTSLEELRIEDLFTFGDEVDEASVPNGHLQSTTPPKSLKTISLYFVNSNTPFLDPHTSKWLFEPRAQYELKELRIATKRGPRLNRCMRPVVCYALPTLESLFISGFETNLEGLQDLETFLAVCSGDRLQTLSLRPSAMIFDGASAQLPYGIEILEFDCTDSNSIDHRPLETLIEANVPALHRLSFLRCTGMLYNFSSTVTVHRLKKLGNEYGFKFETDSLYDRSGDTSIF